MVSEVGRRSLLLEKICVVDSIARMLATLIAFLVQLFW
jgi:hypothetical protein